MRGRLGRSAGSDRKPGRETCGVPKTVRNGAIAQLGERLNGIQEVGGTTPPGSTSFANKINALFMVDVRGAKPVAGSGRTGARGDEFWQVRDRWGGWD